MNGYVPWDVEYLKDFFDWVVSAIGNATNIGIIIFGVILAILVSIMVVKRFIK